MFPLSFLRSLLFQTVPPFRHSALLHPKLCSISLLPPRRRTRVPLFSSGSTSPPLPDRSGCLPRPTKGPSLSPFFQCPPSHYSRVKGSLIWRRRFTQQHTAFTPFKKLPGLFLFADPALPFPRWRKFSSTELSPGHFLGGAFFFGPRYFHLSAASAFLQIPSKIFPLSTWAPRFFLFRQEHPSMKAAYVLFPLSPDTISLLVNKKLYRLLPPSAVGGKYGPLPCDVFKVET